MIEINVSRQSELEDFAARLALLCDPKDVIALYGDLGAGKTVFSRAFIRSCGLPEEEVPSPTFTLVQMYDDETKNFITTLFKSLHNDLPHINRVIEKIFN